MSLRAFLLPLGVLFIGCAQSRDEARRLPAPQSEYETGYALDLSLQNYSDSKTESLLETIEARGGHVRTINPAHGLYEVYGLAPGELEQLAPMESVHKNRFWKKQGKLGKRLVENFCPDVPGAPVTLFKVTPQKIIPEQPTVYRRDGKNLNFNVSFIGIITAYRWEIYGPPASVFSKYKITNQDLNFAPDELGEYEIFLLIRLPNNAVCWRQFQVGLTDDVAYQGPQLEKELTVEQKLLQFPHLGVLGLKNAWPATNGYGSRIAILDTGVDYNHPDLASNMFVNGFDSNDGQDNDKNKFVDDYLGWDFTNNDNRPYDDEMHGTHVAGLSGSLVGVAPGTSILPIKVLGPFGGDLASLAGGIYYAVDRGVKVINMSLGGEDNSPVLSRAVSYAEQRGVLIVVAAGNDSKNIDEKPDYPASLPNDNILTVAATDFRGGLTDYSNIGVLNVDIAAPGGSDSDGGLLSAFYHNRLGKRYVRVQGTSMAAPLVTGIAALVSAKFPTFRAPEIKKYILNHGVARAEYKGKILSGKFATANRLFEPIPIGPRP